MRTSDSSSGTSWTQTKENSFTEILTSNNINEQHQIDKNSRRQVNFFVESLDERNTSEYFTDCQDINQNWVGLLGAILNLVYLQIDYQSSSMANSKMELFLAEAQTVASREQVLRDPDLLIIIFTYLDPQSVKTVRLVSRWDGREGSRETEITWSPSILDIGELSLSVQNSGAGPDLV